MIPSDHAVGRVRLWRPAWVTLPLTLAALFASAVPTAGAIASASAPSAVIVKYRSEGATALDACAESLSRREAPFAAATRDGSDSLDRLRSRLRLGRHRALLGARPAETLERRRERLARRVLERRRSSKRAARPGARERRTMAAGRLADLAHVYRVEIPEDASAKDVAAILAEDPHVEYAQPDHLQSLDQTGAPIVFDDPFLSSTGAWNQPYADLWGLDRIGAPLAWATSQGEGVVVAVVDSGVDLEHPDIVDNVWVHPGEDLDGDGRAEPEDRNGLDDDGNGFIDDLVGFDFANSVDADQDGAYDGPEDVSDADPFDDRGHGTHVAGTIAAVADNGIGIAGVAPRARIMALKGFAAEGSAPDSILWRAVLYAAENGADVVNNSWSCGTPCPDNPLAEDVLEVVRALGTVVVTSAGNATTDVVYNSPERTPLVVTVGSLGFDDEISNFSNRGWLVDILAPGGGPPQSPGVFIARRNVLSLLSRGTPDVERAFAVGGDYYRLAGTSMATPHVAGAAALLLAHRPDLTPDDVRRMIRMSARDGGEPGRDPVFGPGALDLPALLAETPPLIDLVITSPAPGSTHDPDDGPILVRGRATGLASLDVEVGAGLAARVFQPVEAFGSAPVGAAGVEAAGATTDEASSADEVLARWDVSGLEPGPWVIRVRATLDDGRVAEESTVVGLERIVPLAVSERGPLEATRPVVSGGGVFWQREEPESGGLSHDIVAAAFPSSRGNRPPLAPLVVPIATGDGDQHDVEGGARLLVWRSTVDGIPRLERCRAWSRARGCRVEVVTEGEETPAAHWAAGGWIVWTAVRDGAFVPVGCRVGGVAGRCRAAPLLAAPETAGWTIQSFDGRRLVVQRGFDEFALCDLEDARSGGKRRAPHGAEDGCILRPLELVGTPFLTPFRPVHDGSLLVFEEVGRRPVPPPGCESGDPSPACRPTSVLSTRFLVCTIDLGNGRCEGLPISEFAALSDVHGVAVSGRRVVWSMGDPIAPPSLFFCELSPAGDACEVQALTGHVAAAVAPSLDGNRLVWEDARNGPRAIRALALPSLVVPWPGRVDERGRFAFLVYASPGSARDLGFVLEQVGEGGADPVEFDFRPFDRKRRSHRGWGLVTGRLSDANGLSAARLRLRAMTSDGLFTQEPIELVGPGIRTRR